MIYSKIKERRRRRKGEGERERQKRILIRSSFKPLRGFRPRFARYRLKKWDLPKGKLEKNEKAKTGAVREVEEECNVEVRLEEKICTTFHTYTYKNEHILKQTKWYSMEILDDSKMKPQLEESIEKLEWMDRKQIHTALINSYSSIRYVVKRYFYEGEDKWAI